MTNYRRILATTDFSDISRMAVQRASMLARQNGCHMVILHVIEHFPFDVPLGSVFHPQVKPDDEVILAARKKMQGLSETLELGDVEVKVILSAHSARKAIIAYANEEGFDLIVLAPHGKGLLESLGSTAVGVVNSAACDVLIVRSSVGSGAGDH